MHLFDVDILTPWLFLHLYFYRAPRNEPFKLQLLKIT